MSELELESQVDFSFGCRCCRRSASRVTYSGSSRAAVQCQVAWRWCHPVMNGNSFAQQRARDEMDGLASEGWGRFGLEDLVAEEERGWVTNEDWGLGVWVTYGGRVTSSAGCIWPAALLQSANPVCIWVVCSCTLKNVPICNPHFYCRGK